MPPIKQKNKDRRPREFLTEKEVNELMKAANRLGRHGHRDSTIIFIAYRHALRVSKLIALRWQQIDFEIGRISVNRRKNGIDSVQPLTGMELRALRRLKRDYSTTDYVFVSERKTPLTDSTIRKMIARAGNSTNIGMPIHPHMLRHSTGYKLANDSIDTRTIQQYLGHTNIKHTVRYTELSSRKFDNLWTD
ncbi:tyrosine-type recombinase/integrase [Francisella tularensis subsp. novicida]|uniref:tyrosine-type recombinase/integrase n=1 Tax=Francisella tularensis TaxID=263 RepID=UPI0008FD1D30|nr:tyrosine-type recombinase/integrase [Francisella tularensis]APC96149.1 phage integrase family protein [Francisella tularensis subsp. novicida]MBK2347057.1 tyrosine-type recombinase/integrase [Francisella tularensis subsp. novicida]